ncbi:CopG family transcriptional regulator [Nostoc sp.]|uniref:CopG family transcriptional regulator n=1 Tax=Nostoc sp. TaxID=1180 RepID=UPI002FEF8E96
MNKKWAVKRITINLASTESEKLEKYCASTGRPATDVIRELIRSLSITELSASEQTTLFLIKN